MASPVDQMSQPRPDAFEGVLRYVFHKAGVSQSMVYAVTPSSLSGRKYSQRNEAVQVQMHPVMEQCTRLLSSLLLPSDLDALHASYINAE